MAESRSQWLNFLGRRLKRDPMSTRSDRKEPITGGYMNVDVSHSLSSQQISNFNRLKDDLLSRNRALQDSRADLGRRRMSKQAIQPRKLDNIRSGNGISLLSRKSKSWAAGIGMESEQVRDAEEEFMQAVARLTTFMNTINLSNSGFSQIDATEAFTETTRTKDSRETEHPLLAEYYDIAGQVKLTYQELVDEDWAYHEEKVRRNLLIDQERPVSVADSHFEATHSKKRRELEERLDHTLARADVLRDECIAHGLKIEMPEGPENVVQPDTANDTFEVRPELSQSEPASPDAVVGDIDSAYASAQTRMTSISHNDMRSSVNSWRQAVDPNAQVFDQAEDQDNTSTKHISPISTETQKDVR